MFDMHCHILPEVDDGARSMEMALHMLRQAAEEGIRAVFLTPHCQPERWEYDPSILRQKAELLRQAARQMTETSDRESIEIYLGTEVCWCPSVPDWLAEGRC
ncbi:MAG: protein tyrosine phosphatase, partial [Lachnospiraceae bacterium]|nr:protein tyrosine phosphatase [Lachnospiraceae bacterium]